MEIWKVLSSISVVVPSNVGIYECIFLFYSVAAVVEMAQVQAKLGFLLLDV